MSPIYYQIINFIILAVALVFILRKTLKNYFVAERRKLETKMKEASAQHEKIHAEYLATQDLMRNIETKISEIRAATKNEILFESKRIESEAENLGLKLVKDCELKIRSEADRAKTLLQRDLLADAMVAARVALAEEFRSKDGLWTAQMIQNDSRLHPSEQGAEQKVGGQR